MTYRDLATGTIHGIRKDLGLTRRNSIKFKRVGSRSRDEPNGRRGGTRCQFLWSDAHETGIFTFQYLRRLGWGTAVSIKERSERSRKEVVAVFSAKTGMNEAQPHY